MLLVVTRWMMTRNYIMDTSVMNSIINFNCRVAANEWALLRYAVGIMVRFGTGGANHLS